LSASVIIDADALETAHPRLEARCRGWSVLEFQVDRDVVAAERD
jgi:hypothetical protein